MSPTTNSVPSNAKSKSKTSKLRICVSTSQTSLPENQCDGYFDLVQLYFNQSQNIIPAKILDLFCDSLE